MATFSERLRQLRQEKNITLDELAIKLESTKTSLSRYENDKREPKIEFAERVANFFGVSVDYVFGRTDEPQGIQKKFIGNNLALLRGNRTYEEYSKYIKEKSGVEIDPIFLERYEKGIERPYDVTTKVIATLEGLEPDFFYQNNNEMSLKIAKGFTSIDGLSFMNDELREWVKNPNNLPYIEFIYNSFKSGFRISK